MYFKLIGLICVLFCLTSVAGASAITIKINAGAESGSSKALVTAYLTKLLEERSHGRIQVVIDESSKHTVRELIDDLEQNKTQIIIPEIGSLLGEEPRLKIFELPFLFRDRDHLHQILDDHFKEALIMDHLEQKLKVLGIWEKAAKHLQAGSALLEPASVANKIYQGRDDQVSTFFFKALSACPPPYQAENRQFKNWQEITLPQLVAQRDVSAGRHVTLTYHSFSGCVLLMNKAFWSQLPDDLKIIVNDAVKDATQYSRELAQQIDDKALVQLQKQGTVQISRISRDHRQSWRNNLLELYSKTSHGVEKELIEQVANYHHIN